jgi:hypothetical protein
MQQLLRVVEVADGPDQAFDDMELVEDGQLHGHRRQLFVAFEGLRLVLRVLEEEVDHHVAMEPVTRETDEYNEIAGEPNGAREFHTFCSPRPGLE